MPRAVNASRVGDRGFTGESACAWNVLMFQPDLFSLEKRADVAAANQNHLLDLPAILARLTTVCERPRYTFMVLNLIAQAGGDTGSAGALRARGQPPHPGPGLAQRRHGSRRPA